MVDFRYHLVSIVSVFLALALGIVIGTTALNGLLPGDLVSRVAGLTADKRELESALTEQKQLSAADDELIAELAPELVTGRLIGHRVLLVSTPGAPSGAREQLVPLLEAAGATVTATVQLRPALTDPTRRDELATILGSGSGEPLQTAARQLASALVGRDGRRSIEQDDAARILEKLRGEDLVDVDVLDDGAPTDRPVADLVVVLVADGAEEPDTDRSDQEQGTADAVTVLAEAMDRIGSGTVVVGARPGGRGALEVTRGDDQLSALVTTVDGVDGPRGRLVTVLALQEQLCGKAGRYGSGGGTDGAGPQPCTP